LTSAATIPTLATENIVYTRSNGVSSFWINGVHDSASTSAFSTDGTGYSYVVGGYCGATWYAPNNLNGTVDKIQIWGRALTQVDVNALQIQSAPATFVGNFVGNGLGLTNLSSTTYVALTYTGGTNVLVDFSLGADFILAATNNAYFIPTNITSLPNGGGSILCTNNAVGGWSFGYANFTWPSAQVLTMTTNGGAWNLISVKRGPSAANLIGVQTLNFQ
jgi:hypothetical protein